MIKAAIRDSADNYAEGFSLNPFLMYVCGDANGDGNINIGDAVYLIKYVLRGGPAPNPLEAGDANCDGSVNIGDAVYINNYVFCDGPPPCCP